MAKGRQVRALGRKWVINLSNKGQIRNSPGTNIHAQCVRFGIKKGDSLADASSKCSSAGSKGASNLSSVTTKY